MNIFQIGNFKPEHSTENDLRRSLEAMGHQVRTCQEDGPEWMSGGFAIDADLVLYTHTHGWGPSSRQVLSFLDRAREAGLHTVGFHLDLWRGLDREKDIGAHPWFRCEYIFSPDPGPLGWWKAHGVNHVYSPPAILEASCYLASPDASLQDDVIFVGARGYHGEYPFRAQLISALAARYGSRFKLYEHASAMRGHKLNVLYASAKVVVGDSCFAGLKDFAGYTSDRFYESLGRGARLVTPAIVGITEDAPCRTFVAGNLVDLFAKVDEALQVPVAEQLEERKRAVEWTKASHTYRHRLQAMLDRVIGDRLLSPVKGLPFEVTAGVAATKEPEGGSGALQGGATAPEAPGEGSRSRGGRTTPDGAPGALGGPAAVRASRQAVIEVTCSSCGEVFGYASPTPGIVIYRLCRSCGA